MLYFSLQVNALDMDVVESVQCPGRNIFFFIFCLYLCDTPSIYGLSGSIVKITWFFWQFVPCLHYPLWFPGKELFKFQHFNVMIFTVQVQHVFAIQFHHKEPLLEYLSTIQKCRALFVDFISGLLILITRKSMSWGFITPTPKRPMSIYKSRCPFIGKGPETNICGVFHPLKKVIVQLKDYFFYILTSYFLS